MRNKLIAAINIGKNSLELDDDIYRPMLKRLTGKDSLRAMSEKELGDVLGYMKKALGFIPNPPKAKPRPRSSIANKIRAIWITMNKQGFLENGSDRALDAYVQRMTKTTNGQGVQYLAWLDNKQAQSVLESLKRWHYRMMKEHLQKRHADVPPSQTYEVLSKHFANTTL